MGRRVRVRAPATVSNLNCGFDVLGFAVSEPYDTVEAELTTSRSVEIEAITGCDTLSTDPDKMSSVPY